MKPKLQYFSTGSAVVDLQQKLNKLLPSVLPPLAPDGKFGDRTHVRVKEFQRTRGLVADGIVGQQTWAALDTDAPAKPGAPAASAAGDPAAVRHGARIFCTGGSFPTALRLNDPTRPATVIDCVPGVNIPPFGWCQILTQKIMSRPSQWKSSTPPGAAECSLALKSQWVCTKPSAMDPKTGFRLLSSGAICWCKHGGLIRQG